QFAAPAAVVLLADFVFWTTDRNDADRTLVWIAGATVFVADMVTLSWVGMWTGLCGRHANRAAAAAVLRIMVLPWLAFTGVMIVISLEVRTSISGPLSGAQMTTLAWMFISLGNDLVFGLWARERLLHEFRNVATQRFELKRAARISQLPSN